MMTNPITPSQAKLLTALIEDLRPDWDRAGIWAKVVEAKDRGPAWDLIHAALYAAENPAVRSPGVIPKAGEHWTRGHALGEAGTTSGRHARCPEDGHEHEPAHNCRSCRSEHLEAPVQAGHLVARTPTAPTERVAEIVAAAVPELRGSRLVGSVSNGVGVNVGPG